MAWIFTRISLPNDPQSEFPSASLTCSPPTTPKPIHFAFPALFLWSSGAINTAFAEFGAAPCFGPPGLASFAWLTRLTRCFNALELHFESTLLLVGALAELIRVPTKPFVGPWCPDFCFLGQIGPFFGGVLGAFGRGCRWFR